MNLRSEDLDRDSSTTRLNYFVGDLGLISLEIFDFLNKLFLCSTVFLAGTFGLETFIGFSYFKALLGRESFC